MNELSYQVKKTSLYLAILVLSLACLLPFVIMLLNATRSGQEIMTGFSFTFGNQLGVNWEAVKNNLDIVRGFMNSLVIAIATTIVTGYFSALTAYAFAYFNFKGSKWYFSFLLVLMMVPSQLGLLGFYDLINKMGLIDSYIPLIIPAIAVPGTVFFLRQYLKTVLPKTVLEAARIDGASELQIFHKIVIPIMIPGIATISIGAFIGSWNSYLLPLVLLNTPNKFTLPLMIGSLNSVSDISKNQGAIYLAIAISVVPILIVFAFCSKYIISSISAGAVKE